MRSRPAVQAQNKEPAPPPGAMEMLKGLSEQIRLWRKRHDMTQADLAVRSGISVSFISMIERAERSPSYETLVELAQALDIPVSELFRTDNRSPSDDGYFRKLVDFARQVHLSRKQVEQLIAVGRAVFDLPIKTSSEENAGDGRRCTTPGCSGPLLARGLCPSHYRRKLRKKRN